MSDYKTYKQRIKQLEQLRDDHNRATFIWMMTALLIYVAGLGLAAWQSNWFYLLLVPAAMCFYVGTQHNKKAHKYSWLILEQIDKAFLAALKEATE